MVANAAPAKVTFYGRTLTNLLGKTGNFESDNDGDGAASGWSKGGYGQFSLVTLPNGNRVQQITALAGDTSNDRVLGSATGYTVPTFAGRYYVFIVDGTVIDTGRIYAQIFCASPAINTSSGSQTTSQTLIVKVNPTSDATLSFYLKNLEPIGGTGSVQYDAARFYEIDVDTYNKINVDPEFTGDKLADKFPYVDSVQHTQGVAIKKVGKNLLPPLTDINWNTGNSMTIIEPYLIRISYGSSGTASQTKIVLPVVPNTSYVISANLVHSDARIYVSANSTGYTGSLATLTSTVGKQVFNSLNYSFLYVVIHSIGGAGNYEWSNMQLEVGNAATSFVPYNDDFIYLPTTLASNNTIKDLAYEKEGYWYKYKRWQTGVVLDGASSWNNHVATPLVGSKRVYSTVMTNVASTFRGYSRLIKYDGTPMKYLDPGSDVESFVFGTDSIIYASIPNTLTGFGDSHSPVNTDWRNYFNGWKINNGTLGATYDGTGTKYWTAINSPRANFLNKVTTSNVENPHLAKRTQTGSLQNTLLVPSAFTGANIGEFNTTDYAQISSIDGSVTGSTTNANGAIAQHLFQFNIIEHVLRKYGSAIFGSAVTTADRVTWLNTNLKRINCNWFGYGSGPAGGKMTLARLNVNTQTWNYTTSSTKTSTAKLSLSDSSANVDTNGIISYLAYTDASDGSIYSSIYTDFVEVEVELNLTSVPTTGYSNVEYVPYKFDYVLNTPPEELIAGAEGTMSLNSGNNQIELLEGVVVREKIVPIINGGSYAINNTTKQETFFKNRVSSILAIYKDGISIPFSRLRDSYAYGLERAAIDPVFYDAASEYTATYIVLDKLSYTCNAIEAKIEYSSSVINVVNELAQRESDTRSIINSSAKSIAELYKRMKALGG